MTTAAATPKKCAHCNGKMEQVTPARAPSFNRCTSCGRDDRPVHAPSAKPQTGGGTPCDVAGCPGDRIDGRCSCCEKRARWADEHAPKRYCEICEGKITGQGRRFCQACRPVAQKVAITVAQQRARTKVKR